MVNVPINAIVECTDGYAGESTCVIIDPTVRQVTHLVVAEWRPPMIQHLVAVDEVAETTPSKIHLRCRTDELEKMEPFVVTQYIRAERPDYADYPYYLWPYFIPENAEWTKLEHERIPVGELAVRRGAQVEATDGYIGRVAEFLVDADTREITHVLVRRGHLWDQKEVTIPVSQVARSRENSICLKLDKQAVESLPVVAVKRGEGLDELVSALRAERESVRKERREQIEAQLQVWDTEIENLKAKAAEARAEAKEELEERIAASRARRKAARAERRKEVEADIARIDAQLGDDMQMFAKGMTKMADQEIAEKEQRAKELQDLREKAQSEVEKLRELMDADDQAVD